MTNRHLPADTADDRVTVMRIILEEVKRNVKADTQELIQAMDWLLTQIEDTSNPWKTTGGCCSGLDVRRRRIRRVQEGIYWKSGFRRKKAQVSRDLRSSDTLETNPRIQAMTMKTEVKDNAYLMRRTWFADLWSKQARKSNCLNYMKDYWTSALHASANWSNEELIRRASYVRTTLLTLFKRM